MTQKTSPQPDGCRADSLTGPARQVHQAVLAGALAIGIAEFGSLLQAVPQPAVPPTTTLE